jgi:hypothetical protein
MCRSIITHSRTDCQCYGGTRAKNSSSELFLTSSTAIFHWLVCFIPEEQKTEREHTRLWLQDNVKSVNKRPSLYYSYSPTAGAAGHMTSSLHLVPSHQFPCVILPCMWCIIKRGCILCSSSELNNLYYILTED